MTDFFEPGCTYLHAAMAYHRLTRFLVQAVADVPAAYAPQLPDGSLATGPMAFGVHAYRDAFANWVPLGPLAYDDFEGWVPDPGTHNAPAAAEPPRPSPDHMAVYLDQHNSSAWVDYPTMPPGDDVLPLVTANEAATSRTALAGEGVALRIVGWIR